MKHKNKSGQHFTVWVLLLFYATTVANALTDRQVEQRAFGSMVFIKTNFALGSGFFVAHDLVATNYHVIKGAEYVTGRDSATGSTFIIEGATAIDPRRDLAILKVRNFSGSPLSFGNSDTIQRGDTVYAAGYPGGKRSFKKAKIRSLKAEGCAGEFDITAFARIAPGSSGGPVLNSNGEVIGVAVRVLSALGISLNAYAIRVNYLRDLLHTQSGAVKYYFPIQETLYECGRVALGNLYFEMGYYTRAIEEYNRAINQNSGLAIAYLNRAVVWHKLGRTSEAALDFGRALSKARSQRLISIIQQVRDGL